MYARLVIGELITERQVAALRSLYKQEVESAIMREPGCAVSELLVEDGERLVILLSFWENREDCLRYNSSESHRCFVVRTQHHLTGAYTVKLFQME